MAVNAPTCQRSGSGTGAGGSSVAAVTLLTPGIAVIVVAQRLPEAGLVSGQQAEATHPLGALPEIQVRHDQARRSTVCRLQRLAVVGVGHEGLAVEGVL